MRRLLNACLLILALLPTLGQGPALLEPADRAAEVAIPVVLTWQGDAGAAFECDVARDAGFTDSVRVDKRVTGPSLAPSHLLPGITYYWRGRAEGGAWSAARSFTTSDAVPVAARTGRIVLQNGSFQGQIQIMNGDGSGLTTLTAVKMPAHPALSPDGRLIAFTQGPAPWGAGGLWLMEADSSGLRRLPVPAGIVWRPWFAPQGDVVYFSLEAPNSAFRDVYAIGTDGAGLRRLPFRDSSYLYPALSEDGAILAMPSPALTLYRTADSTQISVLPNSRGVYALCFSRDGTYLLAVKGVGPGQQLMKFLTDGSGEVSHTTDEHIISRPAMKFLTDGSGEVSLARAFCIDSPCVSPDGSIILFSNSNLRVIGPDGKEQPFSPHNIRIYQEASMRWQAAPGRWAPDPPAMTAPADNAAAVPAPRDAAVDTSVRRHRLRHPDRGGRRVPDDPRGTAPRVWRRGAGARPAAGHDLPLAYSRTLPRRTRPLVADPSLHHHRECAIALHPPDGRDGGDIVLASSGNKPPSPLLHAGLGPGRHTAVLGICLPY